MGCINCIGTRQSQHNMNLPKFFVRKALLQRVEESGDTRETANIKLICDFDPQNFGHSGSKQQRSIQKYLGYLKRTSFSNYTRSLERLEIEPGSGTRRCMLNMSYNSKGNDECFLVDEGTPDDVLLETGSDFIYTKTGPTKTITKDATSEKDLSFVSPKSTKKTVPINQFANLSIQPGSLFSPVRNCQPSSSHCAGTKLNTHIISVDTRFSEAHREFDVEEVDRIEHEHWAVKGYHIRSDVGCNDKKEWVAKIVKHNREGHKAILTKGKTRKLCYSELATYHHQDNLKFVKEKHLKTKMQLKESADRDYLFWLLVFPKDVILDNSILSGNNKTVMMKTSGTSKMKGTRNFLTPFVYWQIAVKNDDYFNTDSDNDDDFDFAPPPATA